MARINFVYVNIQIPGFNSFGKGFEGTLISHGVASLITVLRQRGHSVQLFDFRKLSSWHDWDQACGSADADFWCFSYLSTDYLHGQRAIQILRKNRPNAKIIVGGAHASLSETIEEETGAYWIIKGEGEYRLPEFIEANNIADDALRVNLDDLPFIDRGIFGTEEMDWPLFPELTRPVLTMVLGRGCGFHCLAGDTSVNTINGKIPIKDLANMNDPYPVLTLDSQKNRILFVKPKIVAKTRTNAELVRVKFDNGSFIECTPDHLFKVFKWGNQFIGEREEEVQADNLEAGMRVRAVHEYIDPYGYPIIAWRRRSRKRLSRLKIEYEFGRSLRRSEQVHHDDRNKGNNSRENLIYTEDQKQHFAFHPEIVERMRINNPSKYCTSESREKIRQAITGKKRTFEQRIRYSLSKQGTKNPNYKDGKRIGEKSRLPTFRSEGINHKVVEIIKLSKREDVYCLEVPGYDWFYANDVLVHNCKFCCNRRKLNGPPRMRSIDNIIAELKQLRERYRWQSVMFHDDLIAKRSWMEGFVDQFGAAFGSAPFFMQIHPRIIIERKDLIASLARVGLSWVSLGIESGSDRILKFIHKETTKELTREAVAILRENKIKIFGNFVLGLPTESHAEALETAQFIEEIRPERLSPSIYTLFPGSELYAYCQENDLILNENWSDYSPCCQKIKGIEYEFLKRLQQRISVNVSG